MDKVPTCISCGQAVENLPCPNCGGPTVALRIPKERIAKEIKQSPRADGGTGQPDTARAGSPALLPGS